MPPRLAAPLAAVLLAAVLLAGCGDSDSSSDETGAPPPAPAGAVTKSCAATGGNFESLRATGISCVQARQVVRGWHRELSCSLRAGASRGGCSTGSYRCQTIRADRGLAVSCGRQGQALAFLAKP